MNACNVGNAQGQGLSKAVVRQAGWLGKTLIRLQERPVPWLQARKAGDPQIDVEHVRLSEAIATLRERYDVGTDSIFVPR